VTDAGSSAGKGRIEALDWARGAALIVMAGYHTLWDLTFYGFIDIGIGISPVWIGIQRGILTVFLLIAGASLWLSHGDGIRWRSFWRRWTMIAASAAAVTLGTYILLPGYVAWFGVLHAIALFSLLALPFIRAPLWAVIAIALAAMLIAFWQNPSFDTQWLSWIGFFVTTPNTADLVPVFPWFGVTLLGLAGARLAGTLGWWERARSWRPNDPLSRLLKLFGRWSLVFYLLHQPLIIGAIYTASVLRPDPVQLRTDSFLESCRASCNGAERFCTSYCQCALGVVSEGNLWFAVSADPRSVAQQHDVDQMTALCTTMAGN
jgi:uncharacterized membrane protein